MDLDGRRMLVTEVYFHACADTYGKKEAPCVMVRSALHMWTTSTGDASFGAMPKRVGVRTFAWSLAGLWQRCM